MRLCLSKKRSGVLLLFASVMLCLVSGALAQSQQGEQEALDYSKDYAPYPQPGTGYVSDHAHLLTEEEEERIERWLWQVEKRSQVEIIVVTINSIKDYPGTRNQSIEQFATALFNTYGIGNMPKNDGVLLLVAKSDRKARIELGKAYGYARDADAQKIMHKVIIPAFKKDQYAEGISAGTEAIINEFANMRVGFPWHIVWIVVAAIASVLIGLSLLKSGKRGWGYVFIGLGIVLILLALYLTVRIVQSMPKGHSSGWSGGGSGGFGGGSSGGGGATGGW
ncbi:uncharacterized protein SAMN02745866_00451 [Alteromonadaceae bacterium Bs31]|nr:uncharacterized protein SAMN02745866_00451 [Alteromonadaceae bacterium Bs31]